MYQISEKVSITKMSMNIKQFLFFAIATILITTISIIFAVGLYAIYLRLDYSFDIGPQFSRFDDELGWTLKPNTKSYINGSSPLRNTRYFESSVYTEANGFRSSEEQNPASTQSIVTIGDSWTFGYCVNYEETYPFFLQTNLGMPVINMGIPAYGSGSTYGLFRRHVAKLRPKIVVYFSIGLWERSSATLSTKEINEAKPKALLPVFVHDYEKNETLLIEPARGMVASSVEKGIYPGGSLTAGYNLWNYLRYVKLEQAADFIYSKFSDILSSGNQGNRVTSKNENYNNAYAIGIRKIMEYELRLYLELARIYDFEFVLMEAPHGGSYSAAVERVNAASLDKKITYIDPGIFQEYVYDRAEYLGLPPEAQRVPRDGHFAHGYNKLIGELVAKIIKEKMPEKL